MNIREFVDTEVLSLSEDKPANEVIDILSGNPDGFVVVIGKEHKVVGVITGKDILKALYPDHADLKGKLWNEGRLRQRGLELATKPVREVMSGHVISARMNEDPLRVLSKMCVYRVTRLPVVEGGRLAGLIRMTRLSSAIYRHAFGSDAGEGEAQTTPATPPVEAADAEDSYGARRIYRRKNFQFLVQYRLISAGRGSAQKIPVEDVESKVAVALNLSASGMFLKCHESIEAGSILELSFEIPKQKAPVVCTARVIHVQTFAKEAQHHLGLEYLDISSEDRRRVDRFVKS